MILKVNTASKKDLKSNFLLIIREYKVLRVNFIMVLRNKSIKVIAYTLLYF